MLIVENAQALKKPWAIKKVDAASTVEVMAKYNINPQFEIVE